jgi:hypothetical protein
MDIVISNNLHELCEVTIVDNSVFGTFKQVAQCIKYYQNLYELPCNYSAPNDCKNAFIAKIRPNLTN